MLALVITPASARVDGDPNFQFKCLIGTKEASIATEDGRLVYRYGTARRTELTLRQELAKPTVLYRYDLLGSGSSQQLRFVNGRYSYGIASLFFAGPRGEEWVGFFVMRDGKLIRWKRCRGDDWFTEDNQLSRLSKDPMNNIALTSERPS